MKVKGFCDRNTNGPGTPSPVTPIPPTSFPSLYSGTPPGDPSSEVPKTGTIVRPGVGLKLIRLPGARNLLMSDENRLDNPTPTSGPGAVLRTPGGKCCWMMNPAVREVNAFWLLLR